MGFHRLITVKIPNFRLFSLLVLIRKKTAWLPVLRGNETATFGMTEPSQCSKAENCKKSDLMLAWQESLRNLAKLTG